MGQVFSKSQASFFLHLAGRIVPDIKDQSELKQARVLDTTENALCVRDPAVRFQFKLFLFVLRFLPLILFRKRFEKLSTDQAAQYLERIQNSPVHKIRTGFWGVKTLVFMGYYGDRSRWSEIGYTPVRNGNEKLNA